MSYSITFVLNHTICEAERITKDWPRIPRIGDRVSPGFKEYDGFWPVTDVLDDGSDSLTVRMKSPYSGDPHPDRG